MVIFLRAPVKSQFPSISVQTHIMCVETDTGFRLMVLGMLILLNTVEEKRCFPFVTFPKMSGSAVSDKKNGQTKQNKTWGGQWWTQYFLFTPTE